MCHVTCVALVHVKIYWIRREREREKESSWTNALIVHHPFLYFINLSSLKKQYMIHRLIGNQYDYGRLYNRTCVANLVARVGGRHSYVVPDEIEVQEGDQSCHLVDCLVQFTPDKWKKIMDQFAVLRESLLRNDACLIVLPTELDGRSKNDDDEEDQKGLIPEENDSVNETLEKHADFTKGYHRMMDLIKFHTCLSHLQPDFETAIQNGEDLGAESVAIPYDNIVAFE